MGRFLELLGWRKPTEPPLALSVPQRVVGVIAVLIVTVALLLFVNRIVF